MVFNQNSRFADHNYYRHAERKVGATKQMCTFFGVGKFCDIHWPKSIWKILGTASFYRFEFSGVTSTNSIKIIILFSRIRVLLVEFARAIKNWSRIQNDAALKHWKKIVMKSRKPVVEKVVYISLSQSVPEVYRLRFFVTWKRTVVAGRSFINMESVLKNIGVVTRKTALLQLERIGTKLGMVSNKPVQLTKLKLFLRFRICHRFWAANNGQKFGLLDRFRFDASVN